MPVRPGPSVAGRLSSAVRLGSLALLMVASLVFVPAAARTRVAASSRAAKAFSALAEALEGRPGDRLKERYQRRMGKVVSFAQKEMDDRDHCTAMRALDVLHESLADPAAFRGKGLPAAAGGLDRRVDAAQDAIFGKAEAKGCAVRGQTSDAVSLEPVGGPVPENKPADREDQAEEEDEIEEGVGPRWTDPGSPEVEVIPASKARVPRSDRRATDPNNPIVIQRRADVGVGGPASPHDMQIASAANVVIVSGNGGAFYSIDSGQTFASISLSTLFGTGEGGFCCDTVLRYAPQVDRFIWLLQGWCSDLQCSSTTVNRMVLAVASPSAITDLVQGGQPAENAWSRAQLTQSLLRETTTWWDYPSMSVGQGQLYVTWNRVRNDPFPGGMLFLRINLAELASGSFRIYHFPLNGGIFGRLAQQSGNLGMLVRNQDTVDAEVFFIRETSGIALRASLPHTSIPTRDYSSASPGGANWTGKVGGAAVKGATVRRTSCGWHGERGEAIREAETSSRTRTSSMRSTPSRPAVCSRASLLSSASARGVSDRRATCGAPGTRSSIPLLTRTVRATLASCSPTGGPATNRAPQPGS